MAKVKTTNADVYLFSYTPVFLDYKNKFVHAAFNHEIGKWDWFINGRKQKSFHSSRDGLCCHWELINKVEVIDKIKWVVDYISGRLCPLGKTIYIHDLDSREHNPYLEKCYDKRVDKVIDRVYKYMEELLD